MSTTHKLKIGSDCWLEFTTYESGFFDDVQLMYIEHASDPWYSDMETEKNIDEEMAKEIVAFLRTRFPNI